MQCRVQFKFVAYRRKFLVEIGWNRNSIPATFLLLTKFKFARQQHFGIRVPHRRLLDRRNEIRHAFFHLFFLDKDHRVDDDHQVGGVAWVIRVAVHTLELVLIAAARYESTEKIDEQGQPEALVPANWQKKTIKDREKEQRSMPL